IFGRMCVPIWFFLIGYANTREIPRSLYIGAILLTVSAVVAGQYLLPLTILVTLGLARRWIDWIGRRALRTYETLAGMFFFLFLLSWPTELLFEYGTAGILFSFYGYVARHRADIPFNRRAIILFAV